jgi:hypothetical protein
VRRLLEVVRKLHREDASRREQREQARDELLVTRQPLEDGVREEELGRLASRSPLGELALLDL